LAAIKLAGFNVLFSCSLMDRSAQEARFGIEFAFNASRFIFMSGELYFPYRSYQLMLTLYLLLSNRFGFAGFRKVLAFFSFHFN